MQTKPIKRNENIARLSRDHHASLMFCWKLRQGDRQQVALDRMKKYVDYFFHEHLRPHFHEEETILFAGLHVDEKVRKAMNDHVEITDLANNITGASATDRQIIMQLADVVDKHVRYEERILFPYLEQLLSNEQLEAIGKQIDGEPAKDNYPDEFWVKPTSL